MSHNYRKTLNHDETIRRGCHACRHIFLSIDDDGHIKLDCIHQSNVAILIHHTCDKFEVKK